MSSGLNDSWGIFDLQVYAGVAPVLRSDLTFVRKMEGCSESLLVRDSADHLWIIKLNNHLSRFNSLANELLGNALCRAVGLPVPEARIVEISDVFLDDQRTWFSGSLSLERPKPGLHFASRFLPDSTGREAVGFLPPALRSRLRNRSDCLGIFIFDRWAWHTDSRQALYFVNNGRVEMTFIDNDQLFGGPDWSSTHHYRGGGGRMIDMFAIEEWDCGREFDSWVNRLQRILPSAFEAAVAQIPPTWYSGDLNALLQKFIGRLRRLDVIAAVALEAARSKRDMFFAADQRLADVPIRILSQHGDHSWLR